MRQTLLTMGLCTLFGATMGWADDTKKPDKKPDSKKLAFIDIQGKTNHKLKENFHSNREGNSLGSLPTGEQTFEGVKFKVGDGMIQLGSKQIPDKPEKVEGIPVNKTFTKLYILHATGYSTDEDTIIGEYTVNWEDGTSVTIPIVYGKDVLDWWKYPNHPDPTRGKVAWNGENEAAKEYQATIRVYLATWENPKPDKKVKSIDYSTTKETDCAPFCIAMTVEEKCGLARRIEMLSPLLRSPFAS